MNWIYCILGALATWRLTHLLTAEDGPWEALVRLRNRMAKTVLGKTLDCFYCTSLWVAVSFAILLGATVKDGLVLWPALSAAAILLEDLSGWLGRSGAAAYVVEGDEDHGLLRQDERHGTAAE
jgi:hypothetical protein